MGPVLTAWFLGVFLIAGIVYAWYEVYSFSIMDTSRRYRYQRKTQSGLYEDRGSGYFRNPVVRALEEIPRYEDEPHRRVFDTKKNEVVYEREDQ